MAKKTYYTKADLMDFAKEVVGDERRDRIKKDAFKKFDSGIKDVTPWTSAIRIITEEDFKNWKQKRENEKE